MAKHLPTHVFSGVIDNAPLVSIDLIVRNSQGKVLVGLRNNAPAKGNWFVPGGRILKDEPFDKAFRRLLREELGVHLSRVSAAPFGIYEHFYEDSFLASDVTTHYVVLAYEIKIDLLISELPECQHENFIWFSEEELLAHPDVHKHTKWYFQKGNTAHNFILEADEN